MKPKGTQRENLLRVLLSNQSGSLNQYSLAKGAGCSYPYAIEFLKKLGKEGFVEIRKGKGRRASNMIFAKKHSALLRHWGKIHKKPKYFEFSIQRPERVLKRANLRYALTTYWAENQVQKYLFPFRMDVYVDRNDFEKWKELLTKEGLVGRGNLRVLLADQAVFYKSEVVKGFPIVCMPQLIVDLLAEGGVAAEAAEKLIARVGK